METDNESFETDKPRSSLGWLKGIGWCMLVLAILATVFLAWNHSKGTSTLQQTLAEMDRAEPGWRLEDIETARAEIPEEENSARNPLATLLPDQQKSRELVNLLNYEAMRQSQKGEAKNALTSCRAVFNAARSLGDEPFLISQLIRIAGVVIACQAIERTLAQGEPPSQDLAALQKLLEKEDAFPCLLIGMRGERAMLHGAFEALERGEVSLDELALTPPSNWLESTADSLWRMDTRQDHALFLSLMACRIREVQLPMHEQATLEKEFEQGVRELPKNAVLTRLLIPTVSKVGEAFRRKHASLRCAIVALAAERYRQEKKAWPDSVEQLCPPYLAAVPLDPYDGAPLRYRRVKDGAVIYSVGQDTVDNGGNLDREHPINPATDIGFRLWDVTKRRQPPRAKSLEGVKPK